MEWWPVRAAPDDAPFTTVSHWSTSKEWVTFGAETYHNDKRSGFVPFLDLPQHTPQPLELALCLAADEHLSLEPDEEEERQDLEARGWRVRHSQTVSTTPWAYQQYIQGSRGEFSCAKPSCMRLQNAWISDRTLCYLASGRPAVVQGAGAERHLPRTLGLQFFASPDEAADALAAVERDYARASGEARTLAEEIFATRVVLPRFLALIGLAPAARMPRAASR
jgi:hypothetical protein